MESTEESVYLFFDVTIHLVESELLHVLSLVQVCNWSVESVFHERDLLVAAEVVSSDTEVLPKIVHVVLEPPLHVFITIVVHVAHIFKLELLANHHLVQRSCEEALQKLTVKDGFAYHAADELEEVQVIRVDVRLTVCVVANTIRCEVEQRVIRIEHGFGQLDPEVSRHARSIDTWLPFERHLRLASQFQGRSIVKLLVGLLEEIASLHVDGKGALAARLPLLFDLGVEVFALQLEVHQVGHVLDDVGQLNAERGTHFSLEQLVNRFFIVQAEHTELV